MAKTSKKATTKKAPTKKQLLKAVRSAYPHIKSLAAFGAKGNPTRVVISCQAEYAEVECDETREIATQDAFQVTRCVPCQREFSKRRRRKNPDA